MQIDNLFGINFTINGNEINLKLATNLIWFLKIMYDLSKKKPCAKKKKEQIQGDFYLMAKLNPLLFKQYNKQFNEIRRITHQDLIS